MLDSWSVHLTLYRMTQCWTRDLCIWHKEWLHVGLVICVSDIIQNDGMLDLWSVYLTLYRMMMDSWSVYLPLYRMTTCWTRDLCICHYTEWQHVGLVICVSAIIQNDNMLDSWSMYLALYRMMLDSWSVHLTLYRMTPCWTRDLCIWHTEWLHVGLVICVSDIIQNDDGLVICVSAIIQNDNMLDSWSVYLPLYRMTTCWTRDLCIWHYTEWCWTCDLCIWHDTEWWWTRDLCIWHFTEWRHVGLVICVSDILQNDAMLDSWSVYLTFTEWCHVGLVICVSDIYRMMPCWTHDLCI